MSPKEDLTEHSQVTLDLAKQEHAEHMEGMDEAAEAMKQRSLKIKAFALDDPNAPTDGNVKTVHFVRHGQGFHNLMADLAKKNGVTWVQVSLSNKCTCTIFRKSLSNNTSRDQRSIPRPRRIPTTCLRFWTLLSPKKDVNKHYYCNPQCRR